MSICSAVAVIQQNEVDFVVILDPHEALTKNHLAIFVDCPVAGEPLAKVRMQSDFIAATALTAKGDRVDDCGRIL